LNIYATIEYCYKRAGIGEPSSFIASQGTETKRHIQQLE